MAFGHMASRHRSGERIWGARMTHSVSVRKLPFLSGTTSVGAPFGGRATGSWTWGRRDNGWLPKAAGLAGMAAVGGMLISASVEPRQSDAELQASRAAAGAGSKLGRWFFDADRAIGAYGGVSYTYPDTVRIKRATEEVTVRDFHWLGRPFEAPIYYGVRVRRWSPLGATGTMVDFIHAKAIAKADSVASYTGSHNGQELPKTAPIKDVFSKLEFSHGHNILTYNGLFRFGSLLGWVRPYVGAGAGVSLPHTEIGFAKDNARTYEYQFAGFAGQTLAGVEIDLGRTSLFLEWKFTYAPYDVPLTHEPTGWLLVTDVWKQLSAWWRNEQPPGGRLTVNLLTHHGVAGVLVKAAAPPAAVP